MVLVFFEEYNNIENHAQLSIFLSYTTYFFFSYLSFSPSMLTTFLELLKTFFHIQMHLMNTINCIMKNGCSSDPTDRQVISIIEKGYIRTYLREPWSKRRKCISEKTPDAMGKFKFVHELHIVWILQCMMGMQGNQVGARLFESRSGFPYY